MAEEKKKRNYVRSGKYSAKYKRKEQRLVRSKVKPNGEVFKVLYRKEVAKMRNETMNELLDFVEEINRNTDLTLDVVKLAQPIALEVRMVVPG